MQRQRPLGLTLIAIGKVLKCVLLIVVGVSLIVAARKGPEVELERVCETFRIDPSGRLFDQALSALLGTTPRKLEELGVGAFFYAVLFAIEGVGLWLQKRWAEWLTIVITISFIPLEIYEIVHRASAARIVTLVLNIAVVVYLVARVAKRRHWF